MCVTSGERTGFPFGAVCAWAIETTHATIKNRVTCTRTLDEPDRQFPKKLNVIGIRSCSQKLIHNAVLTESKPDTGLMDGAESFPKARRCMRIRRQRLPTNLSDTSRIIIGRETHSDFPVSSRYTTFENASLFGRLAWLAGGSPTAA